MNEKKYQVFISSTYTDLREERRKVLDILLMADCIPAGMEAFVATDDEQFEVIKRVIDLCDYYILIIGKRYGSINQKTEKSYTEMEYQYAKQKEIPVLVFVLDDSVELLPGKMEKEPEKIKKLTSFKNDAMENRLASIWKSTDELTGQIAIAIMRAKTEMIRPGWQRAVDFDEASLRREIMESQSEMEELKSKLRVAQNEIEALTTPSNIAFEECEIILGYHYSTHSKGGGNRIGNSEKTFKLPEIFSIIATEMLNVSIVESSVKKAIIFNLLGSTYSYYLNDDQIIKRILMQLESLKLVNSQWSKDAKHLYWGLSVKGKKVRDDMILIKNKSDEVLE